MDSIQVMYKANVLKTNDAVNHVLQAIKSDERPPEFRKAKNARH